jgi:hypothetical protein
MNRREIKGPRTQHLSPRPFPGLKQRAAPSDRRSTTGDSNMAAQNTTSDDMNDSHQSCKCSLEGWREDRRHAELCFRKVVNGRPVSAPEIELKSIPTSAALNALSKCKDLAIDICCGNDPVSICAVQDMFFAFVDRIPKVHCLRSLSVTITVVLPNDCHERPWVVSDIWPSAFMKHDIIHENKAIQPGDLSRMHMIAFLIDPLRKIRGLGGEGKIKEVKLDFQGRTGKVWKEILIMVKDLVRGRSDVRDYELFRRYFAGIKFLITSIQRAIKYINRRQDEATPNGPTLEPPEPSTLATANAKSQVIDLTIEEHEVVDFTADASPVALGLPGLRAITKALSMARIRGSFKDLRAGHRSLLAMADSTHLAVSQLPQDDHITGMLERLRQNRDHAAAILPRKVDVSHYGYNESDAKLAEYRRDPKGYALQEAKRKSERKKVQNARRNVDTAAA